MSGLFCEITYIKVHNALVNVRTTKFLYVFCSTKFLSDDWMVERNHLNEDEIEGSHQW